MVVTQFHGGLHDVKMVPFALESISVPAYSVQSCCWSFCNGFGCKLMLPIKEFRQLFGLKQSVLRCRCFPVTPINLENGLGLLLGLMQGQRCCAGPADWLWGSWSALAAWICMALGEKIWLLSSRRSCVNMVCALTVSWWIEKVLFPCVWGVCCCSCTKQVMLPLTDSYLKMFYSQVELDNKSDLWYEHGH